MKSIGIFLARRKVKRFESALIHPYLVELELARRRNISELIDSEMNFFEWITSATNKAEVGMISIIRHGQCQTSHIW